LAISLSAYYPTGRERMGSHTLQTLHEPILLLRWDCFRGDASPTQLVHRLTRSGECTRPGGQLPARPARMRGTGNGRRAARWRTAGDAHTSPPGPPHMRGGCVGCVHTCVPAGSTRCRRAAPSFLTCFRGAWSVDPQVLLCPGLNYGNAPGDMFPYFANADHQEPLVNPASSRHTALSTLPPTLVVTAGDDQWEGEWPSVVASAATC
jgi:hypothetical protein